MEWCWGTFCKLRYHINLDTCTCITKDPRLRSWYLRTDAEKQCKFLGGEGFGNSKTGKMEMFLRCIHLNLRILYRVVTYDSLFFLLVTQKSTETTILGPINWSWVGSKWPTYYQTQSTRCVWIAKSWDTPFLSLSG